MPLRRAALALLTLLLLAVAALSGCSGGGSKGQSADDLLAQAKKTLDAAKSLHFVLDSSGVPSTGTFLVGGDGDIARPSSFEGTLKVSTSGTTLPLKVISVNGTVWAQLPFTQGYSVVDPKTFGFGDPGALLDPNTGISQLLVQAVNATLGSEKRVGGEVVRNVNAELPGDLVAKLLTSKDPSKAVQATFSIATDSGQLRRAQLTGPFFTAARPGTYTLQLSKFGAHVSITPPPSS